jgi:NAD(P)-dependent dehydrogenase (short-subunit alcohol dehydrogenase family)
MSAEDISGTTALVTGASRGFGRGITTALTKAGVHVAVIHSTYQVAMSG